MGVELRHAASGEEGAWDGYVLAHPHGSPMHMMAWKRTIEEVFGYQAHYMTAWEDGQLRGVLPLLSTPFAVYGGILADAEEVRRALAGKAADLAREQDVEYLELRNAYEEQRVGFEPVSRYVTFTQEVSVDADAVLKSIPRKTRAAVRKGIDFGLQTRITRELKQFERIYDESLRRLGTPSFPTRYFKKLLEHFGDRVDVREILLEEKVTAVVMSFHLRDQVLPYYGASDPAFNRYQPNNFMYYDLMRWAGQNGYRLFDFGRSKKEGSGSFEFKAHWGMEMRELPYEVLLVRRKHMPNFTPNNPRFQMAIRVWRRLPLTVTKALGPYLVRLVP